MPRYRWGYAKSRASALAPPAHQEVDAFDELLHPLPAGEAREQVVADDEPEPALRAVPALYVRDRLDHVGHAAPADLAGVAHERREARERHPHHAQALFGADGARHVLVRGYVRRHEDDAIVAARRPRDLRREEMSVVDRVERAARGSQPSCGGLSPPRARAPGPRAHVPVSAEIPTTRSPGSERASSSRRAGAAGVSSLLPTMMPPPPRHLRRKGPDLGLEGRHGPQGAFILEVHDVGEHRRPRHVPEELVPHAGAASRRPRSGPGMSASTMSRSPMRRTPR